MKRSIFLIILFLSGSFLCGAQKAICHLDRPFYFPGQNLHYAFYSEIALEDSCILSINLYKGKLELDQHYTYLKNGFTYGYFALPFDISQGEYFLQVSAFSSKSATLFPLLTTPFSILADEPVSDARVELATDALSDLTENISIEIVQTSNRRQTNACNVTVPAGQAGDKISIAVRDKSLYPLGSTIRTQTSSEVDEDLLRFIPLKGQRKILNKKANEKAFLFACNPDQMDYRFNWVDPDGSFFIKMIPFYGEEELYFVDNGGNDIEVSLRPVCHLNEREIQLVDDASLGPVIEANNKRKKIYQLFSRVEESILEDTLHLNQPVLSPDMDIDVQDYAIRGKLVDLLKEVITPFKFRKDNDEQYRVKVLYEVLDLKYFYDSDPIFIINGIVTRDFTYIANLPLQDIKRMRIYSKLETIRALKLVDIGGIAIIDMVDPLFSLTEDQRLPHQLVQGLQIPAKYPVEVDTDSEIPQLRSLLYWMPNAQLDDNGQYHFNLPVSDDISTFEIEILHGKSGSVGRKELEIKL